MKLHLPIALLAITVMPAMSAAADTVTYPQITTVDGNTYVNVGTYAKPDSEFLYIGAQDYQKVYYEGDLNLDSGDKLGYIKDGKLQPDSLTNSLYVNGDVTISGDARVLLGGQQGGAYNQGGLVAENVLVDSTATILPGATLDDPSNNKEKVSIWVESFKAKTLTIDGGWVQISTVSSNGTSSSGYGHNLQELGAPSEYLGEAWQGGTITDGLYVNGGTLVIGKTPNSKQNQFRAAYDAYIQSWIGGEIVQTAGDIHLIASTYIAADKIEQTGGTMTLAQDTKASHLRFEKETVNITQSGTGTMTFQGIIVSGDNGDGNLQLNIAQEGSGTINLAASERYDGSGAGTASGQYIGSEFTSADGKASSITQTGNGEININSDYTSATFNVKQSGEGTITVDEQGKLSSAELTLNTSSTFSIAGELNLQNNALINVIYDTEALLGDAAIQLNDGVLSIEDVEACVSVSLTEAAITANMMETYAATGSFTFTVDLISGMKNEDALKFIEHLKTGIAYSDITISGTQLLADGVDASQLSLMFTTEKFLVNEKTGAIQAVVTASASNIPEPTTATLSLLALAALAARRRRK